MTLGKIVGLYTSIFQFDDEKNKTDTDTGWMPVPEMVTPDNMHRILLL